MNGLLRDGLASSTVTRQRSRSPGNTGFSHRSSSIPGEPRLASGDRKLSTHIRIITAVVFQPLAHSPPKIDALPASRSRW